MTKREKTVRKGSDKKTHFGRAGEYFVMSELLLRGWNVAVPVVDIGDDVFVIDDRDKTTRRVQVKAAMSEPPCYIARRKRYSDTMRPGPVICAGVHTVSSSPDTL